MTKTSLIFATFLLSFSTQTPAQNIYLQPCLKLCVIMYGDQSGSMDSATSDIHRWARGMTLIPASKGYSEVGLYSFKSYFMEWSPPTGSKEELVEAIDSFCVEPVGGGTNPHSGLMKIDSIFAERRLQDSTERQVILIHSDYHWDDFPASQEKLKEIISHGVIVILSLPRSYDGCREKYDIHEQNLFLLTNDGGVNIRSNFRLFKEILETLKAIVPCG
ncbi:MAG: VWA domain-containing protein [bacterium]|nr:VWA domain-containing protein [bacterium]